jgi:alkylhydroperoxidase family enzyme
VLLGRVAGLTEEKLAHLGDDPLPDGVYEPDEAAIVRYAQRSTRLDSIDDDLYADLSEHFTTRQLIEICFTVGFSNMINRFHATFRTDLDPIIRAAVGDSCPLAFPEVPTT